MIYDFFTFDGKQAISPFREAGYVGIEFGYRVNLYFYSDGIFEVRWSNELWKGFLQVIIGWV